MVRERNAFRKTRPSNMLVSVPTRSYGFNEGACVYREFNAATDDVQMHGAPTKCCEAGLSATELAAMRAEQAGEASSEEW